MRRALTIAAVLLLVAASGAGAQDGKAPEPDPVAAVRAEWETRTKLLPVLDRTMGDEHWQARKLADAAYDRFLAAFAKADWNAFDAATEAELLAEGLRVIARRTFDAEDYAVARRACEALLDRLPAHAATHQALRKMPELYAACGEFEAGIKRLSAVAEALPPGLAAEVRIGIGDLQAAAGDYEAAMSSYATARRLEETAKGPDPWKSDLRGELALRERVGLRAPPIVPDDCVGGKATTLEALKGSVVMLWIMAPDALAPLQPMERLHRDAGAIGVKVLAATSFERLEETPGAGQAKVRMPADAEDETGIPVVVTKAEFRKHVETFRRRRKATLPIQFAPIGQLDAYSNYVLAIDAKLPAEKQNRIEFLGALQQIVVIGPDQIVVHNVPEYAWRGAWGVARVLQAKAGRAAAKK